MTLTHNRVNTITRGFIKYLTKTGQLELLPEIARRNLRESKIKFDPNVAKVQTPIRLTSTQTEALTDVLSQLFGRPVQVTLGVRPDLIGGIFIRVGDKVIDLSLKTKLNILENTLTN